MLDIMDVLVEPEGREEEVRVILHRSRQRWCLIHFVSDSHSY
jgi:hypothetical protein